MIIHSDARHIPLAPKSVQTVVTSPPYFGLRDYGHDKQIGLEPTPDEYVANMVAVFRQVWRVLRDDGTLWLNLGDSYFSTTKGSGGSNPETSRLQAGKGVENRQAFTPIRIFSDDKSLKVKDLIGIPWRVAFALQADGWYLRQDIIWHKPNPMPESVTDRCTKAHEYIFLLSKSARYYYDAEAIKEAVSEATLSDKREGRNRWQNGSGSRESVSGNNRQKLGVMKYPTNGKRNRRSVWTIATQPYSGAHFATFPPALIEPCILAGSAPGDVVLDPFAGSGTVGQVAIKHSRRPVLMELNPDYHALIRQRTAHVQWALFV